MRRILFGSAVNRSAISPHTLRVVDQIMRQAGAEELTISSSQRTAEAQVRAMLTNAANLGVSQQMRLYADPGRQVLSVIRDFVQTGIGREKEKGQILLKWDQIQSAMLRRIYEVGPAKVSKHCVADTSQLNVIDIPPSLIRPNRVSAFYAAAVQHPNVAKALGPSQGDPAIHLEITQPAAAGRERMLAVDASALNVRRGPSTAEPIIRAVPRGTLLTPLEIQGAWTRVRLADGTHGWAATQFLKEAS